MNHLSKILGFSAMAFLACSCAALKHKDKTPDAMPGTWQQTPIVADGNGKDWPSPYPNYDSKAKIAYATSNDKENLYITMETGDEMTQMKILKQGLVVSVDTGGHKANATNISFPLQSEVDLADLPQFDKGQKRDNIRYEDKQREQRITRYAKESNQLSLEGFIACNGVYVVRQATPCGIIVSLSIDEYKQLVWEAIIPFKAILNKDKITAADASKPISVCFNVRGFKKTEAKNAGDNNSNTGMNNGMGTAGSNSSMRGGGNRGARTAQSDNPMQHLYENTKTWKVFGLSYEK